MLSNGCQCFYIGDAIRRKVDELHISHAEFARLIGCARTSLYRIFNAKSIDIDRLIKISEVLDFDFIHTYYLVNVPMVDSSKPGVIIPWVNGKLSLSHLPHQLKAELLESLLFEK